MTFTRRLGAAVRPVAAVEGVGSAVFRVARVGFVGGLVTTGFSATSGSSSSSGSDSGSVAGAILVDLVVDLPVLVDLVMAGADFFVIRDFDSRACVRVVVGTLVALVVFRFAGTSVGATGSVVPARARVVRRGFAGLAGFRGAMMDGFRIRIEETLDRRVSFRRQC